MTLPKIKLEKNRRYGFYSCNFIEFDGKGFSIKMDYGEHIYLEYAEALSLTSLLKKLLFKKS